MALFRELHHSLRCLALPADITDVVSHAEQYVKGCAVCPGLLLMVLHLHYPPARAAFMEALGCPLRPRCPGEFPSTLVDSPCYAEPPSPPITEVSTAPTTLFMDGRVGPLPDQANQAQVAAPAHACAPVDAAALGSAAAPAEVAALSATAGPAASMSIQPAKAGPATGGHMSTVGPAPFLLLTLDLRRVFFHQLFPIWVKCLGEAESHILLGSVLRIYQRVASLPAGSVPEICATLVRLAVNMEGGDEYTEETSSTVHESMPLIVRLQAACHASFAALQVSITSQTVLELQAHIMVILGR